MTSYIVIASTSVVLIDSSQLTSGQSAIVLLSSQMPPGRTVTVRDSLGYLSSPQSIIVSTMTGLTFMDGTSSLTVSQQYASMSFSSKDANTWNIINTFGFPLNNTIANVSTLAVSTLTGNSLTIGNVLSTKTLIANNLTLQSTSQVFGPLFVSTLVVGTQPSVQIPYETTPGYSAYVIGNAFITSSVTIGGNLQVGGGATFGSSITVAGTLSATNGANINGNLTVAGNLLTQGQGTFECQTALINSSLVVVGSATIGSNAFINSNLFVGQSTVTTTLQTSTIQLNSVGGYIQLGTNSIIRGSVSGAPAFTVNAPIFTPFLSTNTVTANATVTTTTLEVLSTISANTVTSFILGSAAIQNSSGSLVTSSIQANNLSLSNTFTLNSLNVSTLVTSNVIATGSLQSLSPTGYLSTGVLFTSSLQVTQISTGILNAGVIQTPSVQVSSLFISQSFTGGPGLSSVNIQTATIENSQGSLYTGAIFTSSLTASSIVLQSGNIYTPGPLTISTPILYLQGLSVSSFVTSTLQTSTLNTSRIVLGATPGAGSNGPNFSYDSAFPSTNIRVTGGPGDYLSPYFLSNIIPTGQNPAVPYTTSIGFNANYFGPQPPGLLIGYSASLFWAGQSNSFLTLTNGPSLYGVFGQDQTITGTLTQSSFGLTASLYGSSAVSVTFSFQYSPNVNSIDSNTFIQFNNGSLNWNYSLNGTTIQNSLNDMSIRNVYYYGALNFASDPRIKENISSANLKQCYDTISALPLRKFKYITEYCSTFQVSEEPRLGFLATDLLPHFPKSVHVSDTLFPSFSKELMTIDTSQIDMAHLGTTKYLIEEVKRLESELALLKEKT